MVYCWLASLIGCTRLLSETRKPLCSSLFFLLNRTVGKSELILLLGQPRQFFLPLLFHRLLTVIISQQ